MNNIDKNYFHVNNQNLILTLYHHQELDLLILKIQMHNINRFNNGNIN